MHEIVSQLMVYGRIVRKFVMFFSDLNYHGFPLDWVFHLIGAFLLMLVFTKFLTVKKSVWVVCGLIVLKECFDIFGKSRIEYIIPPEIDTPKDIVAGIVGIFLFIKYHSWLKSKKLSKGKQ